MEFDVIYHYKDSDFFPVRKLLVDQRVYLIV